MTLNMLSKFKSLIGYNNDNNKKEIDVEPKKEATIDMKKDTETRVCDCCNEQEVIIESSEMFKIDEYGERIPIFAHPKVTIINGGIYDEITICNSCFETCENDIQKQYVWIFGKINNIHKDVLAKEDIINKNNERIAEIKARAEEEIRKIAEESNDLSVEINSLRNTIELYEHEQKQLEASL